MIQLGWQAGRVRWAGNGMLLNHHGRRTDDGFFLSHSIQWHDLFFVGCDSRSKASQLEVGEQNADERKCCAKGSEDDGDGFVFHCCFVDGMGWDGS
jgi:hypothetical protein